MDAVLEKCGCFQKLAVLLSRHTTNRTVISSEALDYQPGLWQVRCSFTDQTDLELAPSKLQGYSHIFRLHFRPAGGRNSIGGSDNSLAVCQAACMRLSDITFV